MKPRVVAEAHRSICESANCEYLDQLDYSDECTGCPNGHFGPYVICTEKDGLRLGDKIATVAQPIARGIDALLGTDIQNCGGCKKRRDKLNRIF